jgi:hypothetical protein
MIRILKTAAGIRKIDDSNEDAALTKLREALLEQRKLLIDRLESDLNVYIDYRFSRKVNSEDLNNIKDRLHTLKTSGVNMEKYSAIQNHFLEHEKTYLNAEPFYKEIDEYISGELGNSKMRVMR